MACKHAVGCITLHHTLQCRDVIVRHGIHQALLCRANDWDIVCLSPRRVEMTPFARLLSRVRWYPWKIPPRMQSRDLSVIFQKTCSWSEREGVCNLECFDGIPEFIHQVCTIETPDPQRPQSPTQIPTATGPCASLWKFGPPAVCPCSPWRSESLPIPPWSAHRPLRLSNSPSHPKHTKHSPQHNPESWSDEFHDKMSGCDECEKRQTLQKYKWSFNLAWQSCRWLHTNNVPARLWHP